MTTVKIIYIYAKLCHKDPTFLKQLSVHYVQCSAQDYKRAGCHLKRAHLVLLTNCQKGTISAALELKKLATISVVNGGKRATDNKRGTAQSTLCMDNKKDKTELKAMCDCH